MIGDLAHISLLPFDADVGGGRSNLMRVAVHVMVVNWAQTSAGLAGLGVAKTRLSHSRQKRLNFRTRDRWTLPARARSARKAWQVGRARLCRFS